MIPIHSRIVQPAAESARLVDLVKQHGKALVCKRPAVTRLTSADKAVSMCDYTNARREAEYIARRNGQKPALIQLYRGE